MDKNVYCVIMAGGIGSRFWPKSRTSYPKQFLDILGTGKSLIQQTADRFLEICLPENILVVSNKEYEELVMSQLPMVRKENILSEPMRRNTAPCIAYASYRISKENPQAKIIVTPADHIVLKQKEFEKTILAALGNLDAEDSLLTLGIKPSRPDTGYGYIQFEEDQHNSAIRKVKTFTEKPHLEMAKTFIQSGDFYWNSGIFIWNAKDIICAFEALMPETAILFEELRPYFYTAGEVDALQVCYEKCANISIDYGILEKAKNVKVILSDFGWSDLGTWGSLYTHLNQDEYQNAIVGEKVKVYDCNGCMVHASNDKLLVLQGLDDMIVVDTQDVLLVCRKEEEQKIKQFVSEVKQEKNEVYI